MSRLKDTPSVWTGPVSPAAPFAVPFPRLQPPCSAGCIPAEHLPGGFSCEPSDSLSVVSGNVILFSLPEYSLWELPVTPSWQFRIFGVCQFRSLGNWWDPLLLCTDGALLTFLKERYRELNSSQFVQVLEEMPGKPLENSWVWEMLYPIS